MKLANGNFKTTTKKHLENKLIFFAFFFPLLPKMFKNH